MGNPVKQYCVVYVALSGGSVHTICSDAETGEVLHGSRGALNYHDERFLDLAEERTGRTCLKVIRL